MRAKEGEVANNGLKCWASLNRKALSIDDFCPHDLRRTGATWITAVGLPKLYARLLLNHSYGERCNR